MDGTYTNTTADALPPMTMKRLVSIMQVFSDRRPAVPKEIRVHPDYLDVFIGNLREEGFVRVRNLDPFVGLPIVTDADVKFGEYEVMYEHTFSAQWETE